MFLVYRRVETLVAVDRVMAAGVHDIPTKQGYVHNIKQRNPFRREDRSASPRCMTERDEHVKPEMSHVDGGIACAIA